jgi:hypothetical protein
LTAVGVYRERSPEVPGSHCAPSFPSPPQAQRCLDECGAACGPVCAILSTHHDPPGAPKTTVSARRICQAHSAHCLCWKPTFSEVCLSPGLATAYFSSACRCESFKERQRESLAGPISYTCPGPCSMQLYICEDSRV